MGGGEVGCERVCYGREEYGRGVYDEYAVSRGRDDKMGIKGIKMLCMIQRGVITKNESRGGRVEGVTQGGGGG